MRSWTENIILYGVVGDYDGQDLCLLTAHKATQSPPSRGIHLASGITYPAWVHKEIFDKLFVAVLRMQSIHLGLALKAQIHFFLGCIPQRLSDGLSLKYRSY